MWHRPRWLQIFTQTPTGTLEVIVITEPDFPEPPPPGNERRNKILLWIGTFAALAIIGVSAAVFLATRSGEASASGALEEFRDLESVERTEPGLPPQGVYEYDVTGSETIIQGPIEITRAFPGSSPAIVTHTDSGYQWEWRLSSDRTETLGYTVDDRGASASSGRSELVVAGITSDVSRDWTPAPLRYPLDPEVGQQFSDSVTGSDGAKLDVETEVTGTETIDVAGTPVDVSILESTLRFSGDSPGVVEEVLSYAPDTGLLVRYQSEENFTGSGELRSKWDAKLVSLDPER